MSSFDCEPNAVFDDRLVTASKAHRCAECHHPIVPGEKYHAISGLSGGSWWRFKVCVCCQWKRCALADYFDLDCIPFGYLAEVEGEYDQEQP